MRKRAGLVRWQVVFTRQAQKDAKRLASSGLRPKAEQLLELLAADPFRTPPPFEKLVGDLAGAYSRRINIRGDCSDDGESEIYLILTEAKRRGPRPARS